MTESVSYEKDVDARLDYSWDWTAWLLEANGDTITTSTWAIEPDVPGDTTMSVLTSGHVGGVTTVWLDGGTVGNTYRVTNSIVTLAGREDDRTITIYAVER